MQVPDAKQAVLRTAAGNSGRRVVNEAARDGPAVPMQREQRRQLCT